uniref:Rop family plasmid primer RNA-binding protein n=1 Tax=Elaeophora elaphi TaxID=1147741 RepID=A0A0R3S636_9BILA
MKVLRLVYDSVQNLQQLPCTLEGMIDGEYEDQTDLMDEACKLLTMCIDIEKKITNAKSISTTENNSVSSGTAIESLADDGITNTADLNSNQS